MSDFSNLRDSRGLTATRVLLMFGVLLLITGAGAGGYLAADRKAKDELKQKDERIDTLKTRVSADDAQLQARQASPSPSNQPSVSQTPLSKTNYQSANLGFSVAVPKEWAGQWRYQENGEQGILTASVTFFLLNKETKYQDLVTIGKIPQTKYDDAKASGQAVGNAENLLGSKAGYVYVMAFADGNNIQLKNFTYPDAVKAARASFKASFKTL